MKNGTTRTSRGGCLTNHDSRADCRCPKPQVRSAVLSGTELSQLVEFPRPTEQLGGRDPLHLPQVDRADDRLRPRRPPPFSTDGRLSGLAGILIVVSWGLVLQGACGERTLLVLGDRLGHGKGKGRPRSGRPLLALRAKSAPGLGDYGSPQPCNPLDWSALRHAA